MKQKCFVVALLIVSALTPGRGYLALAESGSVGTAIGIGVDYHVAASEIDDIDYDDDYLGYLVGAKFILNDLFAIDANVEYYAPGEAISYIVSPRVSVLYGYGFYFGTGIEKRYVKLESGESDWEDETYFVQVGFEVPLGGNNSLNIDGYYDGLENFSDISDVITDFDSDNVTFGLKFYHYF